MASRPMERIEQRLRSGMLQGLMLAFSGILAGFLLNEIRGDRIPWVGSWSSSQVADAHLSGLKEVSFVEARALYEAGTALFLDAREPVTFDQGHLPGALNVPPEEAETYAEQIRVLAHAGMSPIAYCDGVDCPLSAELARALQDRGVTLVRVLVNGWSLWREAGLNTEGGGS